MNTEQLEKLFNEYERAFNKLDIRKNAEFFADTFISAGPKGTIAQNKNDFLQKAEQASEFYKSIGQTSAKILSKKLLPISDQYTMVTLHWGVTFQKTGNELIEFDVTYLVQETGNEPKIILFIAHQDEEEAMKKLGLVKPSKMSA
ncbi:MAG TPA: DUF4440 domain-containing protein [Chitinophagaceae bacterium]|nr:DUF4440 domain-containing protein [Chitinophagaceae bacterium]